jgi:ribonuclease HI
MSVRLEGPVAYTDGGCIGNPGPGGWGVHVEYPDGRVIELGGAELQTTNNRMELRAAIEAARAVADWPQATIVADSQYVLRGITEWLAGWKRNGWLTTTGQPVVNRDLWEELDTVSSDRLTWEWAKGHSGVPGNERCDEIASWFAESIRPLTGGRHIPTHGAARRSPRNGTSHSRASSSAGASYISLVDGIPARHATWSDCEQRVKGVKSARFKKVRSPAEADEVFASWGVTAGDLFWV